MDENKKNELANAALGAMYEKMATRITDAVDPHGYKRAQAIAESRDAEFVDMLNKMRDEAEDELGEPYFDIGGDVGVQPGSWEDKAAAYNAQLIANEIDEHIINDLTINFVDEHKEPESIQVGATFHDTGTGESKYWNGLQWVSMNAAPSFFDGMEAAVENQDMREEFKAAAVKDIQFNNIPTIDMQNMAMNPNDMITITGGDDLVGGVSISYGAMQLEDDNTYIYAPDIPESLYVDLTTGTVTLEEDPAAAYDRAMSMLGDD